jgi:hypothetical protein
MMSRGFRGTVVAVRPELRAERLSVVATVRADNGETVEAHMPDREVSAVLPRSVLMGAESRAPVELLDTVGTILARMTEGRRVRVWEFKERKFFSFLGWRSVRFVATPLGAESETHAS